MISGLQGLDSEIPRLTTSLFLFTLQLCCQAVWCACQEICASMTKNLMCLVAAPAAPAASVTESELNPSVQEHPGWLQWGQRAQRSRWGYRTGTALTHTAPGAAPTPAATGNTSRHTGCACSLCCVHVPHCACLETAACIAVQCCKSLAPKFEPAQRT